MSADRYKHYKRQELADLLGIKLPLLKKWLKMGLPHRKVGRTLMFKITEIEEWMNDVHKSVA